MTWVRWVAISRRKKKRCKLSINSRLICLVWIVWVNIMFLTGHHHSSGNLGIFVVVLSWSNTQVLLQPFPHLLMLPSHQYKWELCFSNQGSPKTKWVLFWITNVKLNWLSRVTIDCRSRKFSRMSDLKQNLPIRFSCGNSLGLHLVKSHLP